MKYNRSDDEWDLLTDAGIDHLVERARAREMTTYSDMNAAVSRRTGTEPFDFGLEAERAAMGHLLGRIVDATWDDADRLMISALVHYLGQNDAGPGFYALAVERGLLPKGARSADRFDFWVGQVSRIHDNYAGPRAPR